MSHFETNPKSLKDLLAQINMGELALPDFQRNFVWDPGATEELIESIMRKYPAGSLLFLKHDGSGFDVREFEGAPKLISPTGASYLVLDGQQRLTSMYQAFFGKGDHRFFLDIETLSKTSDIEESVWHESLARCKRLNLLENKTQAEKLICPLETLLGQKGGFHSWIHMVLDNRPEKDEELTLLRSHLTEVYEEWILPILEYHFPVITLASSTPLEAVCKMFETLNRRGVKLTVFELLMARSFASDVSLRSLWDRATKDNPELEEFDIDPYYVLQTISLMRANTIKRRDVLNLDPKIVEQTWDIAVKGLAETLRFARKELGVLSSNLLPYNTMLVPMAAIWTRISALKGPAIAATKEKLSKWFWCTVFSQAYEKGPSSRAVSDHKELIAWLFDSGPDPRAFGSLVFTPAHFTDVTPKQRALYKGTLALIASKGARDFHKGDVLTFDYLTLNKVDDHHIFPQSYLKKKKVPESKINCILNRTLIDRKTNISISDTAPSKYLGQIRRELGVDLCRDVLASHLIDVTALDLDDFSLLFEHRSLSLFKELEARVGRKIPDILTRQEKADETQEEQDDENNRRDQLDPRLVNAYPDAFLEDQPKWVADSFDKIQSELRAIDSEIWWKLRKTSLSFYSPSKHFLTIRISKSGLRLIVFTRGKTFNGVEPIVHKNRGGELWGRLTVRKDTDLAQVITILLRSIEEMKEAIKGGESTAWWAMSSRGKVA